MDAALFDLSGLLNGVWPQPYYFMFGIFAIDKYLPVTWTHNDTTKRLAIIVVAWINETHYVPGRE